MTPLQELQQKVDDLLFRMETLESNAQNAKQLVSDICLIMQDFRTVMHGLVRQVPEPKRTPPAS